MTPKNSKIQPAEIIAAVPATGLGVTSGGEGDGAVVEVVKEVGRPESWRAGEERS